MINILLKELKNFSRQNWWVYIIFFICLFFIYYTGSGNLIEITLVFMAHFLGDIFIMMMGAYYSNGEMKKGTFSQIGSYITFGSIGLYAGLTQGKWSYIIPQISFLFPNIKGYFRDVKNKDKNYLNWKLSLVVGILLFVIYFYFGLIKNIGNFIQVLGFTLFPLALMINTDKNRYFLSLVGIFFIAFGSGYELFFSFLDGDVKGVDISYTLLPFTVFIFFLKNIKKYL